jgi:hypothetical protein
MRTTLTLEDDVAATLERVRKSRDLNLKDAVNEALRRGLRDMEARPKKQAAFRTQSLDVGQVLINGIDNFAEALAYAEGEGFK